MPKVVTQDTIKDAQAQGLNELLIQPSTIVTMLAREYAQDHGFRLRTADEPSTTPPPRPTHDGSGVTAKAETHSENAALREAVIESLGHVPEGLDDAIENVLGSQDTPDGDAGSRPFLASLVDRARSSVRHIVLCEGEEERILQAAGKLLEAEACRLTILGDEEKVRQAASRLGVDLDRSEVVNPATSPWTKDFAEEYARLRSHKGVTHEEAARRMQDVSYFGTMMVHQGHADGMVSGAVHTTAETIRPALEIIKTTDDVSSVTSALFMVLKDRVLVFADCAVNPKPDAEQLAQTAMLAGAAAKSLGVEPKVAMLSYSTGSSGAGADVDLVVEATELARKKCRFPVDGPMQYDAAVDPDVAGRKLPDSSVAGGATVMVFPDLNAGNISYKAVQQSSGALAVGPILLGLRKPVNDLSRGATVDDIVNTVVITAIQAADTN